MGLYLSFVSILLLGLVAGLLLAVWFQLRGWRDASQTAPLLAEKLAMQLMDARTGLADLKRALVAHGPELERLISESGKARVELQFLLQRVDQAGGATAPLPTVGVAHVAETVAGANGVATAQGRTVGVEPAVGDPLETLLAGLNAAAETPLEAAPVRRGRVGPITQAELDLQQQVRRAVPAIRKVA